MIRVLIADDEAPARAKLRRLVHQERDARVVGEAASGAEALEKLRSGGVDLALLDVEMPDLPGLRVADGLRGDGAPVVVFVTAHESYAVQAFAVRAFDYLLKPVAPARLRDTFARVRKRLVEARTAQGSPQPVPYVRRLLLQQADREILISTAEIDWIEADRNYVHIHTREAVFQHRATLQQLADALDPAEFLRVNRSAIVRLDAVKEISPWAHGDSTITLKNGGVVVWSRRYRAGSSLG
jgi:two-component system LytT family response regulator